MADKFCVERRAAGNGHRSGQAKGVGEGKGRRRLVVNEAIQLPRTSGHFCPPPDRLKARFAGLPTRSAAQSARSGSPMTHDIETPVGKRTFKPPTLKTCEMTV